MRLLVLLFVATAAFGQGKKERKTIVRNTYLMVSSSEGLIYCGYTQMRLYFTNKQVSMETPVGHIDLKIVERRSDIWFGIDEHKNEYTIRAIGIEDKFGFYISPRHNSKLISYTFIQSSKLCGNEP